MASAKVFNSVLILTTVLLSIARIAVTANQLFSFGMEAGDTLLGASDDESVIVFTPIVLYGSRLETSIFVSVVLHIGLIYNHIGVGLSRIYITKEKLMSLEGVF